MAWLLPPLPPTFQAALRDVAAVKPDSRVAAAERLGRADDEERPEALRALRDLATDAHPSVRATALAGLGMLGAEDEIEVVVAAFDDAFPEVREFAVLAAGQIGGDRALESLRASLKSPAPEVRFQAVAAVAELAPDSAAEDLLPLLRDADAEVRGQVVSALAGLGAPHLSGQLARGLSDPAPPVRLEAALALASHGDRRGEAILLAALRQRVRVFEVAPALAELTSAAATEDLARLAGGWLTHPHLRACAGAALLRLGDPRGEQALRRVLTGLRSDARSYAVELVRQTQAQALCPELVRLAERPRGADLLTIIEALATFAREKPSARAALERLAQRADEAGASARGWLARLPAAQMSP